MAKKYVSKAKRGQISVNSIKTYMMGIQSFLEFHEIALPWKKISKFYPADIANNLRAYTKEEIIKILSVADIKRSLYNFAHDIYRNTYRCYKVAKNKTFKKTKGRDWDFDGIC